MHIPQSHRFPQSPLPKGSRISRWVVALSVPFLLLALLVASMRDGRVALAATTIQVGDCVGSGNFYSIQEAVKTAVSGTVINICPNTYSETVNLSLMDSIGDITLRRMPGQTDDVLITSALSPSIWITNDSVFSGDITLESLQVQAATNAGIGFASSLSFGPSDKSIYGNVIISDVTAHANFLSGARLDVFGDVTVINSDFSDNGATGLLIRADENLSIVNTTANNNGNDSMLYLESFGIALFAGMESVCAGDAGAVEAPHFEAAAAEYTVNLDGVTAADNQSWGIYIHAAHDANINATEVYSNGFDGLLANVGLCQTADLTLTNSIAENNGTLDLTVDGEVSTESTFEPGGFRLVATGRVRVSDSEANANTGFGFCTYSMFYETPFVEIQDTSAAANTGEGYIYTNDCSSFGLAGVGSAETTDHITADTTDYTPVYAIAAPGARPTLVISNSSAISNGGLGGFVLVDSMTAMTLSNITAVDNVNGVVFGNSLMDARLSSSFANAQRANANSFEVQASGVLDSAYPIAPPTVIQDAYIQGNLDGGVVYSMTASFSAGQMDITADVTSTHKVAGSVICENGTGLRAARTDFPGGTPPELALIVDARGNWWGSESGPFHNTANPEGEGNAVVETVEEIQITDNVIDVTFAPWIDTIDASATPSPTLKGIPVHVQYQFRDDADEYFLNGVGAPNNGPRFTLSTTNGTLAGDAEKSIVDALIEDTVNPIEAGTLVIDLDGPCGLDSTQEILVATPAIDVQMTPDAQGVAAGDSALFTVTVTNMGDVTLTDITVTAAVAPACARAKDALDDLGVNASTTYTCELSNITNNLVNTIAAQGFALINEQAAGHAVSATDSAELFVASLSMTKTVYVDGYREVVGEGVFNSSDCALNSEITVPVGAPVKYCYVVTNTGDYTVTTHTLVDSDFANPILTNLPYELGPGESFSSIDAGVEVTKTLFLSVTNIATWTAEIAAPIIALGTNATDALQPVATSAQATVTISPDDLDQDGDGIPDNIEGAGDIDNDGIPDFLDPAAPTNEAPTKQPAEKNIYLPALRNHD